MIREIEICPICHKKYAEVEHHLVFGSSLRRLAEEDNLKIKICNDCHTLGAKISRIHDNTAAEALSKMLGQALYENNMLANGATPTQARKNFKERYGISYL